MNFTDVNSTGRSGYGFSTDGKAKNHCGFSTDGKAKNHCKAHEAYLYSQNFAKYMLYIVVFYDTICGARGIPVRHE